MTTRTTDVAELSPEQLAARAAEADAAAAAARAELERRAQARTERLAAAQLAWDRRALDRHRELEQELTQRGARLTSALQHAVVTGDLTAALAAWMDARATRYARSHVRSAAENAAVRLTGDYNQVSGSVSIGDPDLIEQLVTTADEEAGQRGVDLADSLLGERPATLDDLDEQEAD